MFGLVLLGYGIVACYLLYRALGFVFGIAEKLRS